MKRRAFTLIELLVVIAIIAILAAILFPVFAQAKAAAKKTVDISNLKEIALAHELFKQDHDDYMVKTFFGDYQGSQDGEQSSGNPWWTGWDVALQPYIKSKDLYRSPLDSETIPREPGKGTDATTGFNYDKNGNLPGSYRLNESNSPRERWNAYSSNLIDQPAQSITFAPSRPTVGLNDPSINYHTLSTAYDLGAGRGDGRSLGTDSSKTFVCNDYVNNVAYDRNSAVAKSPTAAQRGQGKANYAFDDGHAKTMPWAQTWQRVGSNTKSAQGKDVTPTMWRQNFASETWVTEGCNYYQAQ